MANVVSLSNCGRAATRIDGARLRAAVEIAVVIAALFTVLWTDHRTVFSRPARTTSFVAASGLIAVLILCRRPSLADLGLDPPGWTSGLVALGAMTTAGVLAMAAIAPPIVIHGDPEFDLFRWMSRNWHADVAQQVVLQLFLMPRMATLLAGNDAKTSVAASAIFGALHAPNVSLVLLTTVAGFGWCEWYRRNRNLPAAIVSHIVLAVAAIHFLGLADLRVGIGYVLRRF